MKNVKFIYRCFLSSVLFLIVSGAFYSTEYSRELGKWSSNGY